MPNNTYTYPFNATLRDNRTKTAIKELPLKKVCGSDLLLSPRCSVNVIAGCGDSLYFQPVCVAKPNRGCVSEFTVTFTNTTVPPTLDGFSIYFGGVNPNSLAQSFVGWNLLIDSTNAEVIALAFYNKLIELFGANNAELSGSTVKLYGCVLDNLCQKLPYTYFDGFQVVEANTLSAIIVGANLNKPEVRITCCKANDVVPNPPEELCENEYVTLSLTFNSAGTIQGAVRIYEDCPDIYFADPVSGISGFDLANNFATALQSLGYAGVVFDGFSSTVIWNSLELTNCCLQGQTVNVRLGEAEFEYTDFDYSISCCPSSCLIGTNPIFRMMFDGIDVPSFTINLLNIGYLLGSCVNLTGISYTVLEASPGAGITGADVATVVAQILIDSGRTGVTVIGNLVKWSEADLKTCCELAGENVSLIKLTLDTDFPISYVNYSSVLDCCTRSNTNGNNNQNDPLCEDLGDTLVRWKFLIVDNPAVVYGNRPSCVCGVPPPNYSYTAASIAVYCGCSPEPDSFALYQTNATLPLIDTGCASSFSDFVSRYMYHFSSQPAPDGCTYLSGWFFNSIVSYNYVPTVYMGQSAYEVTFIMDKATLLTGCPCVCESGFTFFWGKTNPGVQIPGIVMIENVTCCELLPEIPEACPPAKEIPETPCVEDCTVTDMLYFQFQMPDVFNDWDAGAKYGWTDIGDEFMFCSVRVYTDGNREVFYKIEDIAVNKFVAQFPTGETFQQITIDPTNLPQRFYLEFIFKVGACDYISFYTEWYEKVCCNEETFLTEGEYLNAGRGAYDCRTYYYGDYSGTKTFGDTPQRYSNAYRIHGTIERDSVDIETTEVGNDYFTRIVKTAGIQNYLLRTKPIPPYVLDRLQVALRSKQLKIDGYNFKFTGNIPKNNPNGHFWNVSMRLALTDVCRVIDFTCSDITT